MGDLVVALLTMPVTSADVEQSFSLASLFNDPNRGATELELRRCAVGLYVNGEAESRSQTTPLLLWDPP